MIFLKIRNSFIRVLILAFFSLTSYFLLLTSCFLSLSGNNYAYAEEAQPTVSSPLERGIRLLNEKKPDEALKAFEEASSVNPTDPLPFYYSGVAYHIKRQFAPALNALNKALNLQPNMPPALLRIGMLFEDVGRINNAREVYTDLIETGVENEYVKEARERLNRITSKEHFKKASQLFIGKQYEEALKELDIVLSLTPEDAEALFSSGMVSVFLKKPKEAVYFFKKALENNPNHVNARLQLAIVYESQGDYENAIKTFKELISFSPNSTQAKEAEKRLAEDEKRFKARGHFEATAELIRKELWTEALAEAKKVLEAEPDNPDAHFNLGLIHYKLKQNDQAIEALKHAIDADPKLQKAYYQLGVVYDDMAKYKEAVEEYEKTIAIDEKAEEATKARERIELINSVNVEEEVANEVKELLKNKDVDSAIKEIEGFLMRKKGDTKLLMTLAALYQRANRYQDVASTLEKLLSLSPKDIKARFFLANTYELMREYEKALDQYRILADQDKETPKGKKAEEKVQRLTLQVHYDRGKKYLLSGNYEASLIEMKAVLDVSPDEPLALFNMGVLYDRLNSPDEAVSSLKKAVTIVPDYTIAYFQLGLVYEKMRKFDEARDALRKVIEIDKEGKEAKIAQDRINSLKENEELTLRLKEAIGFMEKREWDNARKSIESLLVTHPSNYMGYYYLGIILNRSGIIDEAKAAFKKVIAINPKFAAIYLQLGDMLMQEGEYEEARNNYEQAILINKDSPEAATAGERLKNLKAWWGSFSMSHSYNSNIAFRSKAQSSANSNYNLGLSYTMLRRKNWNISTVLSGSEAIYYESQFKGNSYSAALNGTRNFLDKYTLSGSGTYSASFFEGKPTVVSTHFSGNAGTNPGGIPSSATLAYSFSNTRSFVNKLSNANQHNLNLSLSQKMSARDSLTGSYGFSIYQNLDPIGSNYANRTHAVSLSYGHHFFSFLNLSLSYSRSFINYSNPDSTTLFQRYRSNVSEGMNGGLSVSFSEDVSLSFSYTFSYAINRTNLAPLTAEEQQQLKDLLSTPLPTVGGGGGYTAHNAGLSLSVRF